MTTRNIPAEIRRNLREEVNFCCPINNCQIPFLEYHHFDPPWNEGEEHKQAGMIALCPNHHRMADANTWSVQELKEFKTSVYIEKIKSRIEWNLANSVIIVGKNYFLGESFVFRIRGREVLGLTQYGNKVYLNALFWDSNMKDVLTIENNEIITNCLDAKDFYCTASGTHLRIEALQGKTYFDIKKKRVNVNSLIKEMDIDKEQHELIRKINSIASNNLVTVLILKMKIETVKFIVKSEENGLIFDFRNFQYDSAKLTGKKFMSGATLKVNYGDNEFVHIGEKR